jgi:hypothetical protein
VILALLGILIIEAIGMATLTLLCSDLKRVHWSAKLGLSYGLGLIALTVTLFVASWCGLKPAAWVGLLLLVILWGCAWAFRRAQLREWLSLPRRDSATLVPPWQRLLNFALIVFLVGICAAVSAVSLSEPLVEWDVIAIWALKAKALFAEPISQSGYFTDITKAFSHADYPVLHPMAMTWVWTCAGTADWQLVKVLSVALLLAYVATFYGLLRRTHDRTSALMFTALLAGLPYFLSQTTRLSSDVVMSFFAVSAFGWLYLWLRSEHDDDLRLAGFLSAGILFTKKEGLGLFALLLFVAVGALLWQKQFRKLPRAGIWLVGAPTLLTGAWFVFVKLKVTKVPELTDISGKLGIPHLLDQTSYLPEIARGAAAKFAAWEDWLAFWVLLALVTAFSVRQWVKRPLLFLFAAALLPFLMYGFIFMALATPPDQSLSVEFLMEYTAHRILLHGVGVCAFFMAECAREARLLPWMKDR